MFEMNKCKLLTMGLLSMLLTLPAWGQKQAVEAFEQQRYEDAIKAWDALLKEDADLKEAYYNQGNANYKLGKVEEAVKAYENALSNHSKEALADVYYNLGNAQLQLQDVEKAREFYKQALRLRPGDEDAKANLELLNHMPPPPPQDQNSEQDQKDQEGDDQNQDQNSQSQNDQQDQEQQDQEQKSDQSQDEQEQQEQQQQDEQQDEQQDQQESQEQDVKDQEQLMNAQQLLDALKDRETENMREQIRLKTSGLDNEKDW